MYVYTCTCICKCEHVLTKSATFVSISVLQFNMYIQYILKDIYFFKNYVFYYIYYIFTLNLILDTIYKLYMYK